jgi:tetratricopeptide (TPR) repeat protein
VNKALAVTEQARKNEDRFNAYYRKAGLGSVATNLGLIHLAKQQYAKAESEALRAFAVTPDEPLTLLLLGNMYLETGRDAKARETFEKLIRLRPDDALSWRWYREACWKLGDAEAVKLAGQRLDKHAALTREREASVFRIPEKYRFEVVYSSVLLIGGVLLVTGRYVWSRRIWRGGSGSVRI